MSRASSGLPGTAPRTYDALSTPANPYWPVRPEMISTSPIGNIAIGMRMTNPAAANANVPGARKTAR